MPIKVGLWPDKRHIRLRSEDQNTGSGFGMRELSSHASPTKALDDYSGIE